MSTRFDIATPRKGKNDKTYWTKIGTAWKNDNGGIQLVFDALPIPDSEGRVVANLFEPRSAKRDSRRAVAPRSRHPIPTMILCRFKPCGSTSPLASRTAERPMKGGGFRLI
jgi:hypothetical protein